jgi:hypothetical protein
MRGFFIDTAGRCHIALIRQGRKLLELLKQIAIRAKAAYLPRLFPLAFTDRKAVDGVDASDHRRGLAR